ncbi:MAG: F0F1 ATP synthase subunit gamma [Pseudomonadales bacterium]|nr:F0F1 ATP synthase subunit gamma [Pseudomonadales bacterium]
MAGTKEIRTQIASVKSTQKITSAMEMVAASKMRKAQDRMEVGKPYATRIRSVVGHIANSSPEYQHAFMQERDVKNVAIIIVSTDRGLCGGLNINLFKKAVKLMAEYDAKGIGVELCTVGTKASAFFGGFGANITATVKDLGEQPKVSDLIGAVKVVLDAFNEGKVDKIYLLSNEFVNTMTQDPQVKQLLPLEADEDSKGKHRWDYLYEPDAETLLDGLLTRYIESQIYQAVVENGACEQAARMVAMKNATDNAGDLIDGLQLVYNKARQAAITQELSEIVSGAAAV